MYEIPCHEVDRGRIEQALTDIERRVFARWHMMTVGDEFQPEAFADTCDELLDHVAASALADPALSGELARAALRTAAECAAAVPDRRLWPNGDFEVGFPILAAYEDDPKVTSPETSYSLEKPQTPPVAEWVRSFALCLISSAFEVPWRRGMVLKLDIAPEMHVSATASPAALAEMDALADYLADGDDPPLVVKPDAPARVRAALRLDAAGPRSPDQRLLRVLLDDDREAFEQALADRLGQYRDGIGDDPEPRTLLPLTAIALANLAVLAHGWRLGVRSGYLPEGLLPEPPAGGPPPGTRQVDVPSRRSLPDVGDRLRDGDVLEPAEGLELLARLVELRTAAPDPRLTGRPDDARRLVAMCDGSPDAIEMLAALLAARPGVPLADFPARLRGRPRPGDAGAVVGLVHDHLTGVQQRALRLMTLNPGAQVSTPALAALTGLPAGEALAAAEALARLQLVEAGEPYGWWRLPDRVRAFAAGRTPDGAGEHDDALARLLEHYRAAAADADRQLHPVSRDRRRMFTGRNDALIWLDIELPNLLAAARAAADTGHFRVTRGITLDLGEYLDLRQRTADRHQLYTVALAAARQAGDQAAEADALNGLAIALRGMERFEESVTAFTDAAALHRQIGDVRGEGRTLNNLGNTLLPLRRFEEAITAFTDAADIDRKAGERRGEGLALNNLGIALRDVQRFEEALTALTTAAEIFQQIGDRRREGLALNNLALTLQKVRRLDEAITAHTDAAGLYRQAGDRHGEATAWHGLGWALHAAGRPDEAAAKLDKAAARYEEAGDGHWHQRALAQRDQIRGHRHGGG